MNTLDDIKLRKNFYRDNFRRMVSLLMICVLVILSLVLAIIYVQFTRPAHAVYATSADGKLTKINPVPRGTGLEQVTDQKKIIF